MKLYRKFCMLVSTIAALAAFALPCISSAAESASRPPSKPSVVQPGTTDALDMIFLKGKIVTGAWKDFFYIGVVGDYAGVRVEKPDHGLSEGTKIDILGELRLNAQGERCIAATSITPTGDVPKIKPLGMSSRSLLDAGVWAWRWVLHPGEPSRYEWTARPGWSMSTGLLLKTWGRIGQIDPEGQYFYICDGTDAWDGTLTAGARNLGIRVAGDGRSYAVGQFVTVTGNAGIFSTGDGYPRRIVWTHQEWIETLGNP